MSSLRTILAALVMSATLPEAASIPLFGEAVQRVEHLQPQGRCPPERIERCAHALHTDVRTRPEWTDEKLRVPVEAGVRPPVVDAGIHLLVTVYVPEELERLFGEDVDVVEHLQVRSGRVEHIERSDAVPGNVEVVVEGEVLTGPGVDLHEFDVRVPLILDVGDVVVEALVEQVAEPDEHPLPGGGPPT